VKFLRSRRTPTCFALPAISSASHFSKSVRSGAPSMLNKPALYLPAKVAHPPTVNEFGSKIEISGYQGVKDAKGNVALRSFKDVYGMNLTLEQGWMGQTLFQDRGGPYVDQATYTDRGTTEVEVGSDYDSVTRAGTVYHELTHVLLGDFGRSASKGVHGAPGVDDATDAAQQEAEKNAKEH